MSHDKRHRAATQEELRDQVEQARADLGRTVEDLAAKADVKARAQDRAHAVREQAGHKAHAVREQAGHKAGEMRERVGHGARSARSHRAPLMFAAAGSGAVLLTALLVRLRGHDHGRARVHTCRGGRYRR